MSFQSLPYVRSFNLKPNSHNSMDNRWWWWWWWWLEQTWVEDGRELGGNPSNVFASLLCISLSLVFFDEWHATLHVDLFLFLFLFQHLHHFRIIIKLNQSTTCLPNLLFMFCYSEFLIQYFDYTILFYYNLFYLCASSYILLCGSRCIPISWWVKSFTN